MWNEVEMVFVVGGGGGGRAGGGTPEKFGGVCGSRPKTFTPF